MEASSPGEKRPPSAGNRLWLRVGLVALAVVVGLVAWIATRGGDDEPVAEPEAAEARVVGEEELADVAATVGHPVYWAGEMADTELEVSENPAGTLVRYLQEDDDVGAARAKRVAIGSYVLPNPRKALNGFGTTPGATVTNVPGIGKVVISPEAKKNVYFVDPDNEVQVEVYAPSSKQAIELVRSGKVQPVG